MRQIHTRESTIFSSHLIQRGGKNNEQHVFVLEKTLLAFNYSHHAQLPSQFYDVIVRSASSITHSIWFQDLLTDMIVQYSQCRLSATIQCLSHRSAHVRTLSTSVLRDILHNGSIRSAPKPPHGNGIHNPSYQYLNMEVIDWQTDIEKCLTWEAHSRISNGMSIKFLDTAAKELGCTISM